MASKGPIVAAGAITGALFFWRRKRKAKRARAEHANGEVSDAADAVVEVDA